MAVILHVDLDGFFVAVERQLRPDLKDRPLVIGGQPNAWGRVVAVSPEAAARGVRTGLSLAIAAQRCPDAVFLDGAVDRYLEASAAVDELLRDPSLVGVGVPVEWSAIDSVFLDLSGAGLSGAGLSGAGLSGAGLSGAGAASGSAMGSAACQGIGHGRRVAERLQEAVARALGFDVACGLAGSRIAAQMASRLSRPRGLLYVLPGYEARLLAPLDVGLLPELPPGTRQRLLQEGVATLGALGAMDPAVARGLLGSRAATFCHWAQGVDPRPVNGGLPPRSLAREVTLADADLDEARAEAVVQHMVETLGERLRQRGWFAQTITVRVRPAPLAAAGRQSAAATARPAAAMRQPAAATEARGPRASPPAAVESRTLTLREATASDRDLQAPALAIFRVLWRRQALAGIGVVLSNLQRVGAQIPLFPVHRPLASEASGALRTRAAFRSLVEGRYLRARTPDRHAGAPFIQGGARPASPQRRVG